MNQNGNGKVTNGQVTKPQNQELAPLLHNLAEPQSPVSGQLTNSPYERRLLSLFIERVKQTGELDHPELVKWLEQVYAVETHPQGQVLLPETVAILKHNLTVAQNQVARTCRAISTTLEQLIHLIAGGTVAATPNSPEIDNDTANTQETLAKETENHANTQRANTINLLSQTIDRYTRQLQQAITTLIDITRTYTQPSLQAESSTDDYKTYNLIREVQYLTFYIAKRAQVQVIQNEFLPQDNPDRYFRRLQSYLTLCPRLADELANCVADLLNRKVACPKFLQPEMETPPEDSDNPTDNSDSPPNNVINSP